MGIQGNDRIFDSLNQKEPAHLDDREIYIDTTMESNREGFAVRNKHASSLVHCTIQILVSGLCIVSTKAVILDGYHYPARLLSMHVFATLLLELAVQGHTRQPSNTVHSLLIEVSQSATQPTNTRYTALLINLLEAVCISGSLICEYEALLHFKTLPALTMLLGLQLDFIPSSVRNKSWTSFGIGCLGMFGMFTICLLDPSIIRPSLLLSGGGVLLACSARVLRTWTQQLGHSSDPGCHKIASLLAALACTLGTVAHSDWRIYTPMSFVSHLPLLTLSVGSGMVLLRLNLSLFRPCAASDSSTSRCHPSPTIWPMLLAGFVTIVAAFVGFQTGTMVLQYAGFAMSLLAMHFQSKQTPTDASAVNDSLHYLELPEKDDPDAASRRKRSSLNILLLIVATLLAFPTSMFLTLNSYAAPSFTYPLAAEQRPPTNNTLDIVISRYDESSDLVLRQLHPLLRLPILESHTVRIVVYDTLNISPTAFQINLRNAIDPTIEVVSEHRQNFGREAAAYLHHMNASYDALADHTLFIQAKTHYFPQILQRIEDYFVPNTGFMAFPDLQAFCENCEQCWDHLAWSESKDVLDTVIGETCKPFPLTYRGQFLVSRSRIRARKRSHYEDLLEQLSDLRSELHSDAYNGQPWLPGKVDSLNSPIAGFTLERTWAAMMGCWDRKLIDVCPSLPAGRIRGLLGWKPDDVGECQCLDWVH